MKSLLLGILCVPLSLALPMHAAQLITNPDFESSPFDSGWTANGVTEQVDAADSAARLSFNTAATLGQSFAAVSDFTFDCMVEVAGNTADDSFHIFLESDGGTAIEIRGGNGNVIQLNIGGVYRDLTAMSGGSNFPVAGNTPVRIQVVGRSFGTSGASYDVAWSEPGSTVLSHSATELTGFLDSTAATSGSGLTGVRFDRAGLTGHSYWMDDVTVTDAVSSVPTADYVLSSTPYSTAEWMSGQWGLRFTIQGGTKLNGEINGGSDYPAGASQIVDNFDSIGYVISNLTNNAHGYLYTLRTHPYIDIANEIHPDFVPSLANETQTLESLKILKAAGLKVILYIAGDGPSATGGTPDNAEYKAAWQNYYQTKGISEAAAWRLLIQGFVERLTTAGDDGESLVDGFWVDHATSLPGSTADFVDMLREIDPSFTITINDGKAYFAGKVVGSDGGGTVKDYKVFDVQAATALSDYTNGHPTPLSTGAPPNSWSYEEFTHSAIKDDPWAEISGKRILKHHWSPMRLTWTGQGTDLQFDLEQAYRFVRSVTDAGGAFTWANTSNDGLIPQQELNILKAVDQRMMQSPKPDVVPYVRPIGAYLKAEIRWTGGGASTLWSDPGNWSSGTVPAASNDAVITTGSVVTVNSSTTIRNLTIEVGADVQVLDTINFQINGNLAGTYSTVDTGPPEPEDPTALSRYYFDNDANDSIGSHHGTLVGDAGFASDQFRQGTHALVLDGAGDAVDLTAHIGDLPRGSDPRTISVWFNSASTSGNILHYGTNTTGARFELTGNQTEAWVAVNGHKWGRSDLSLASGWHHLALVFPSGSSESDEFLVYLNGTLVNSETLAGAPKTVNTGDSYATVGEDYSGYVDDLVIYNTALSQSQVTDVMNDTGVTIPVSSIIVSGAEGGTTVYENNTLQMNAVVLPDTASNPSVSWSVSSDTGSATIDADGLLTGVTPGTVSVTATANDSSGIFGQVSIMVEDLVPISSIEVRAVGGVAIAEIGRPFQMEVTVLPANASIQTVHWEVEAEGGTGTIDSNGVLTATNDGSLYVHATATDGSGVTHFIGLTALNVIDVDSDGMNDNWEEIVFGDTSTSNENSDFDQDGQSDLSEYITGTNPKDATSRFEYTIESIDPENSMMELGFHARAGTTYTLRISTDLGSWESVSSIGPMPSDNPNQTLQGSPESPSDKVFSRLLIEK